MRPLRRALRFASLAIALALAAWAISDDSLIGGGPGFGSTQAAVLGIGVAVAATCLLPLVWNARALALVISVGLVLVFAELALQTLLAPRYKSENQLDAQALYRPIPGAVRENRREAINGGDRILYRINSQGFRGDELDASPRARIVVYGDSFTHAYYSDLEHTFAVRLEHYLGERLGPGIEVVNAGVAGYGPDQELVKMERELPVLAPDLVLVAVFSGNDFGDLVRNKLFRVDGQGGIRPNAFTIAPQLAREMEVQRNESILKRVIRDAVQALAIRVGLREAKTSDIEAMSKGDRLEYFRAQHLREYDEYVVRGDDQVQELAWDSYDADVSLTPNSDAARYKIQLMDGVLGRMQQAAAQAGAPLVLIPIPHPLDVGGHETGEVDRAKYPDYRPRGLVEILEQIAARRGIPSVDLYSVFAARGTEAVYFRGFDDHWNDAGQDLAAEVVASFLGSHGLLDGIAAKTGAKADGKP
ncbi:MAG: SGNH/GDSL hydrolase family protein [Myxococcota bacterium]